MTITIKFNTASFQDLSKYLFQCDENEELRCVVKWLNEEVQDGL